MADAGPGVPRRAAGPGRAEGLARHLRRLEGPLSAATGARADLAGLADRFREVGYTYDGVVERLGPEAHAALSRNATAPGLRATTDGDPLATLTRLWLLQAAVPEADLARALPGRVPALEAAGLLRRSGDQVRALVDVRPYADGDRALWLLSDLTPGLDGARFAMRSDHVLGVSSASTSLARLTVRDPVATALDLGTGCGVQIVHLAGHAERVVGTDVNPRALWMARLNADLNDVDVDLREGSLYEPVDGERFDLVVTNPPFVISPGTGPRLVYRDSGLPGDEVVRRVVTEAPAHLAEGGRCQVLANWVHTAGEPWESRLGGWLEGTGCDAWVVQREDVDPARYVEMWLADAGLEGAPDYVERYDAWLGWLADQRVESIGFGWLNLRRTGAESPDLRLEEWPWSVEQPVGPEVAGRGRRTDALRALDDAGLLAARPVRREDVRQETYGEPGAGDPEQIVLRQQRGMRRARQVDTVEAGLVGAADGDLGAGQILDALSALLDAEPGEVRDRYLPVVRELVGDGFLELPPA